MATAISIIKYDQLDPRLGRHVEHDERSWSHQFMGKSAVAQKKTTHWTSQAPGLDQLKLGSCTCNAQAQWLNTDVVATSRSAPRLPLVEADAVRLYELATSLDNIAGKYPPQDTGSTGNAAAKAAVKLGYIKSYGWLFSFQSVQAAIELTPLSMGTLWTNQMFTANNGLVTVGKITDANIAGGHQYLVSGIDWEQKLFEFRNSWGEDWGKKGYFAMGFRDVESLLEAHGDVTVPKMSA